MVAFSFLFPFFLSSHVNHELSATWSSGLKAGPKQPQQFPFRFGEAELLGPANDFAQFVNLFALLVDQQFGIPDDVDEQNMADLKFYV